MISLLELSRYSGLIGFVVGLPTTLGTCYQVWRTRQETKEVLAARIYSRDCLEFVLEDGTLINLVVLDTLHSLPSAGDVVLLPGSCGPDAGRSAYCAYRVRRVEHIYSRVEAQTRRQRRQRLQGHARLAKAVAHVEFV